MESGSHLVIVGPTASGKSALAVTMAELAGAEVISADAMAVYRGMDIGTAKPTPDERHGVPHHVVDVADPHEDYHVARFQREATAVLERLESVGRRAVVVGGTGLYVDALVDGFTIPGQYPEIRAELDADERSTTELWTELEGLDPLAASRMEPTNRRRVVRALEVCRGSGQPFSSFGPGVDAHPPTNRFELVGLAVDPEVLATRIDVRVRRMMEAGLLDEVRRLLALPAERAMSRTARQALGYKELIDHFEAGRPLEECVEAIITRTRQFARRQRAWFRRDPRITWLDATDPSELAGHVIRRWSGSSSGHC